MKTKIFFICLVFCLAWQAKIQASDNNTIVNDNVAWATLGYVVCPKECPVWTQYVYFDGDSIVADYSYKKIFSCDDRSHENIKYEGLMREQCKKTYFIPANSETEYLLYDFSLEEGMTFEYTDWRSAFLSSPLEIRQYVKVDFVEINGIQKKRISLTGQPPNDHYVLATWIENIGSSSGLLYPCSYIWTGSNRKLLCYFENNELIYKNPEYSECYYDSSVSSIQAMVFDRYSVYPNPVDDILTISPSNSTISRIEIFNISGEKVYSQIYEGVIDISSLSKGMYFLKAYNTNEQVLLFKFIKK